MSLEPARTGGCCGTSKGLNISTKKLSDTSSSGLTATGCGLTATWRAATGLTAKGLAAIGLTVAIGILTGLTVDIGSATGLTVAIGTQGCWEASVCLSYSPKKPSNHNINKRSELKKPNRK